MAKKDFNCYIKKSHIKAVDKFNEDLKAWAAYTGEAEPTLYEDANISFTLSDVRVEDGKLCYKYDGRQEQENQVFWDEGENEWFEMEGMDSIPDYIKFWRACLRRAKRYWAMDSDKLDAIQNGEIEDESEEEE